VIYEGTSIGEAHVRKLQDRPPARRRPGDLHEPEAQAAAGLILEFEDSNLRIGAFEDLRI
jgi:hypothetical protein